MTVGNGLRAWSRARPGTLPGIAPPVEVEPPVPVQPIERADSLFVGGRLDLNRAGAEHLELLPGIGPALASRVVDYRRHVGAFVSVDQLAEVRGIGPKTVARLRPHVVVRQATGEEG